MVTDFSEQYWEEHYQKSGKDRQHFQPSQQLIAEVENLSPGIALDAGCGEGIDAIWLAKNGWDVTAVDISETALGKDRSLADDLGADVDWQQADLMSWTPAENYFDLVVSQYVHATDQDAFNQKIANAVKSGGTLIIIGHEPPKNHEKSQHAKGSHITARQVAHSLDSGQWDIEIEQSRINERTAPNGKKFTLNDSILRARKL